MDKIKDARIFADTPIKQGTLTPLREIELDGFVIVIFGETQSDGSTPAKLSVLYNSLGDVVVNCPQDTNGELATAVVELIKKDQTNWKRVTGYPITRGPVCVEPRWYVLADGVTKVPNTTFTVLYVDGSAEAVRPGLLPEAEIEELLTLGRKILMDRTPPPPNPSHGFGPR